MRTIIFLITSFIFSFASIYNFEAKNFFNKNINFNNFKKDILVVFVSYDDCKFTKELRSLNDLYLKYKNKKVRFAGFAINDTKLEDKKVCSINYGVEFDMFDKHSNSLKNLSAYTKEIYFNNKIALYSPIIIYNNKIIKLDRDIKSLDDEISQILKTRK